MKTIRATPQEMRERERERERERGRKDNEPLKCWPVQASHKPKTKPLLH